MRVDAVKNSEQLKVKMSISEMALTWKENALTNKNSVMLSDRILCDLM